MDEHNGALLNKDVDYAGIWSEGKADGKLAFRIDTAWLTRGAGKVKPQYLVSAYRELIEGERSFLVLRQASISLLMVKLQKIHINVYMLFM